MFSNLIYSDYNNNFQYIDASIPKLPKYFGLSILKKLTNSNNRFISNEFTATTKSVLYYFRAVQYWIKILDKKPIFIENGREKTTSEMKPVYLNNEEEKHIVISVLSSTLFFLHYIIWASCQVINSRDFIFPFSIESINKELKNKLVELGSILQDDYQNNSKILIRNYSSKGRVFEMKKQHYYIKKSKHIIDEIDKVLAEHYGFTEEELDFIINYDIKYRMGKS